jgi:hypothetical protein
MVFGPAVLCRLAAGAGKRPRVVADGMRSGKGSRAIAGFAALPPQSGKQNMIG